ncbi:hypothetical protein C6401_15295 [Arthrobacter woluwensis]|uniref:hypothetical protein n=1 Tax=Arthrobacter woluwensis TaxID=156980 RepID=UPI000D116860|nr:hypothetical protein [Arthrobacter woluwensis]PSS42920.1 hypothetical protein C6401_15295 [Arthrobacter woluwensis]
MSQYVRAGELNASHLGMSVSIDSIAVRARGSIKSVWHQSGTGDETRFPRKTRLSIELPDGRGTVDASLATTDPVELLSEGAGA